MKHDQFLYTDGHDVVVTQSSLQTKKANYQLKGITDFGLLSIKAHRIPGLVVTFIGLLLILTSDYHVIPASYFSFLSIPPVIFDLDVPMVLGGIFCVIGTVWTLMVRKHYALRIETAEGRKNVIVSKKKEYVSQILQAIRRARLA